MGLTRFCMVFGQWTRAGGDLGVFTLNETVEWSPWLQHHHFQQKIHRTINKDIMDIQFQLYPNSSNTRTHTHNYIHNKYIYIYIHMHIYIYYVYIYIYIVYICTCIHLSIYQALISENFPNLSWCPKRVMASLGGGAESSVCRRTGPAKGLRELGAQATFPGHLQGILAVSIRETWG